MQEDVSISEFYELWVTLARATDALQCIRQNYLRQFGVSAEQLATLFAIISLTGPDGQGASVAEISRLVFRQPHSVSEMITRLEKMGLVKKEKVSPTGNNVAITVTEKGYNVWMEAHDEKLSAKVFSTLPKAKRERLLDYLNQIQKAAREVLGPNPNYVLRP